MAALPYDVYSREEACREVARHPESFLAIDRAETWFGPETDTYAPKVYEKARELLWEKISEGSFVREDKPCFYLYEQVMNGRSQTGIVACASVDDYCGNVIKKHENTREDKEEDRIRHVDACDAQTGPIFLAYRQDERLRGLVAEARKAEPACDFVSEDGVRHRVFTISDPERIQAIGQAFADIPALYIADGHHRCASAVKVGLERRQRQPGSTGQEPYNFFLSVLFPDEELRIMDYNRVVRDLNGLTPDGLLARIGESFHVAEAEEAPYRPEAKGRFGMYLEGKWYTLSLRGEAAGEDAGDPVKSLDVSALQEKLLGPVLGITDPKTDGRIDFVGGIRGLEELERRVDADGGIAFSMYPTSMEELFAVADAGLLMPPKSTWFEPKLRSGLFLHSLLDD